MAGLAAGLLAALVRFVKVLACLGIRTLASGVFLLVAEATPEFGLTWGERCPFGHARFHHRGRIADWLYAEHLDIELKIFNRVEPLGHAAEHETLEPEQVRLGDSHGPNRPALAFGFDRVGPAEDRVIGDVVLRPLTQARQIARLHHLVYVPLDTTHERTHLSVAQLLRLILRVLLLLILLLRLLLRESKPVQRKNGRR